ncbi:MAG: DUF4231 domain-containing protein [Planctomycetota bacterium]|jgi:hypothetical protein
MDEETYLKERLEDQIGWYDKKSQWNQKIFKRLRTAEIIAAATIPLLSGYITLSDSKIRLIVGFLGVTVAIIAGIVPLCKFHEHWVEYRTTCETLKHHKYLFLTKSSPYNGNRAFNLLVENVESFISKENSNWQNLQKESERKSDAGSMGNKGD